MKKKLRPIKDKNEGSVRTDVVKLVARSGLPWTDTSAAAKGGSRYRHKVKKDWPDITLGIPTYDHQNRRILQLGLIELKAPKYGRLSSGQRDFLVQMAEQGAAVCVANSLESVKDWLDDLMEDYDNGTSNSSQTFPPPIAL